MNEMNRPEIQPNRGREIEEKTSKTDPMVEQNDIDAMAASAGVEILPEEPLGMKEKLDERDADRE